MRFRQLAVDIAIYGAGDLLLRSISFLTLPIYTRIFTPEEYGVWSFVLTFIGLLSGVLALGGQSAYARYFFETDVLEERQSLTSTLLIFLGAWSLFLAGICVLFAGRLSQWLLSDPAYATLFVIALFTAPLTLTNELCGQVLRNQFKASTFSLLNVMTALLNVGLSLVAVLYFEMGILGLLAGVFVATVLMLPIRLWAIRSMLKPSFSWSKMRELLAYGVPLVPMSLAYWVFSASDRLILGRLSTLGELGLYAVANNITRVLIMVSAALGQAWSPHAIRIYEEERDQAPAFYGMAMTYLLTVFGLLCVGITVFATEALTILSTPTYLPAAAAVGPLALAMVASATTQITAGSISLMKRTYYFSLYSWISALLNLGLNIWLVPRWGMMAAAWTTTLSYGFLTIAYLLTSQRLWAVQYEQRRSLIAVMLIIVFTLVAPLLPEAALWPALLMKSGYCLAFVGLLFALGVLDRREASALRQVLQRWRGGEHQTEIAS